MSLKKTWAIQNLSGKRFGRLVVIGRASMSKDRYGHKLWDCKCDCGTTKMIRGSSLGITKSCGCLQRESNKKRRG